MIEELNNTGILISNLNEIEISLAIELYKLTNPSDAWVGALTPEYNYIGVYLGQLDYWNGGNWLEPITLQKLAFESGLNPDWAERIVLTDNGEFAWESRYKILKLNGDSVPHEAEIKTVIEKQTENWSEQDEKRQENVMQNGNEGLHYNEMSNTEMARDLSTKDAVKNPSHYQFFEGVEVIEIIAKSMTLEQFKGYCLGNRLKYRLRAGNKDKLEQDIAKSDFYLELYEKHKHLCEA